jgi:aspartyl-tRNA(Asn)/glutamyl-tRNA(Gln) amidotransferase subunit B
MLGEVSRVLNERGTELGSLGLRPSDLADLIRLVEDGTINLNTAKEKVFPALLGGQGGAAAIVEQQGLAQISDRGRIQALVSEVLAAHPGQLAQFRAGKESLKGFFVGQVMKAGKGRLNAPLVNDVLDQALPAQGEPS